MSLDRGDIDHVHEMELGERAERGQPRGKYWICTYFPSGEEFKDEPRPVYDPLFIKYLRANPEICPDTERFHWQICAVTHNRVRLRQLQSMLQIGNAHCQLAITPEAVRDYCSKEETKAVGYEPIEFGEWPDGPTRGRRTDLSRVTDSIRQGLTIREIASNFPEPFVRYYRGFERLRHYQQLPRRDKPTVEIHWGITGAGKTKQVFDRFDQEEIYCKDPESIWWDGYDGQEVVLVDDFYGREQAPAGMSYAYLLRLCDRYPLTVQVKGGYTQFNPKFIIFTSNKDPNTWWGLFEDTSAFFRRVDRIVHYEHPL